jgi:hypothetical protein
VDTPDINNFYVGGIDGLLDWTRTLDAELIWFDMNFCCIITFLVDLHVQDFVILYMILHNMKYKFVCKNQYFLVREDFLLAISFKKMPSSPHDAFGTSKLESKYISSRISL